MEFQKETKNNRNTEISEQRMWKKGPKSNGLGATVKLEVHVFTLLYSLANSDCQEKSQMWTATTADENEVHNIC